MTKAIAQNPARGRLALPALLALWLLLTPLAALGQSVRALAKGQPILITAESLDLQGSVYTAVGSVVFQRGNTVIRADHVSYDQQTGIVHARGNVKYEDPEITIKAHEAELNLDKDTGVLKGEMTDGGGMAEQGGTAGPEEGVAMGEAEVFVRNGNYHIRGKSIEKLGRDSYLIKDATYTTCDAPGNAWCVKGRTVRLQVGREVNARQVTLRINNIPVLYLPYLWAPLLSDRKTGLLLPSVGYSDTKGLYLGQEFFWAMRGNHDATLKLDWYSRRGLGTGLDYRYLQRSGAWGRFKLYHIRDRKLDRDFYELKGHHRRFQGEPLRGFLNLNLTNEADFPSLYQTYLSDKSRRYLPSAFSIRGTPITKGPEVFLRGNYYIDLKSGVGQSGIIHRLPELGLVQGPVGVGPFAFEFNTAINNFLRQDGANGQRFHANLRASHTAGKTLTLYQSLGLGQSAYWLDDAPRSEYSRESFQYLATLNTRLGKKYSSFTHVLVPEISVQHFTIKGRTPPAFDSLEMDPPKNTLEVSLMNRLRDGRGRLAALKLSRYIHTGGGDGLGLSVAINRPLMFKADVRYDLKAGEFEKALSVVGLSAGKASISLGQKFDAGLDVMLHTLNVSYARSRALKLSGWLWYDSKGRRGLRELAARVTYRRQCWGFNLEVIKGEQDFSVLFTIKLLGLGPVG